MSKTLKATTILVVLALIELVGGMVAFAQSEAPVRAQDGATDTAGPVGNGYGQRRGATGGWEPLAVDQEAMHTP
jgi:hypothetical protein